MALRRIVLLILVACAALSLQAQQVRLSRIQYASGAGYVPYTDANGKQGYTLLSSLLSSYISGTGTTGDVAVWSGSSTLTSTGWNMNTTTFQGGSSLDPSIGLTNNIYAFNGAANTGLKSFGINDIGITAGDLTNPVFYISGTGNASYFDLDDNGSTEWNWSTTEFYCNLAFNAPLINSTSYTFKNDTDTGMKREGANILAAYAGDGTNPITTFSGTAALVTFDPDLDGTDDVSISATTTSVEALTASGIITANGGVDFNGNSTSNTAYLVGTESGGINTRVILGEEFALGDGTVYDTLHLSAAVNAYLMAYYDNVGSSQSFSLTGPASYDTLNIAVTGVIENGIEYGAPNPSADSAIIFTFTGIYEISFHYNGELSTAGTNQTLRGKWVKNSTTSAAGSAMSWGYEAAARQTYSQAFIYSATAGDYLQFLVTPGTGGAATLTMATPKITVKRLY